MKTYNIDRKKVAVTGFSMGGAGAWYYGLKDPDRFCSPFEFVETWRYPFGKQVLVPGRRILNDPCHPDLAHQIDTLWRRS